MNFWNFQDKDMNSPSVIEADTGVVKTYRDLENDSSRISADLISSRKKLAFLFCDNSYSSILLYISLLRSGNATLLLDSKLDLTLKQNLINIYKPELIITRENIEGMEDYTCRNIYAGITLMESNTMQGDIYENLAVLLSTSGTTGSPRLVRLTQDNVQANAQSISEYLNINSDEKPITTLPMSYSYGLSVINSHLLKGAAIICSNASMITRDFWNVFNKFNCTSFAGVPYNYSILKRLKFDELSIPSLRYMTQAGGRLSEEYIKYFYEASVSKKIKFYVMYGQTEATARISYVPYENLCNKIGSVGIAIPGGKIRVLSGNEEITEPQKTGELVYTGKNVMMGYAESRQCLAKGDELNGTLFTGDLAYKDDDGFTYITGRLKRFIKIFGLRLNLDELEKQLENIFVVPAACIGNDDSLKIFVETTDNTLLPKIKQKVFTLYHLQPSCITIESTESLPVTPSGKKDYQKLNQEINGSN